jgi:Arc/MetJ-type ribon-helix-helix transcriptional regulator
MYPHVTQFETRDAAIRDAIRLDRERRQAAVSRDPIAPRHGRIRMLLAVISRTS